MKESRAIKVATKQAARMGKKAEKAVAYLSAGRIDKAIRTAGRGAKILTRNRTAKAFDACPDGFEAKLFDEVKANIDLKDLGSVFSKFLD